MSRLRRRRRGRADPVERYLRRLSYWAPRRCRHDLLLEAERHLYDMTRHGEELGLSRREAQICALRAFGPAWRVGLAARGLDPGAWYGWTATGQETLAGIARRLSRLLRRRPLPRKLTGR
jgi:hypothetical protein